MKKLAQRAGALAAALMLATLGLGAAGFTPAHADARIDGGAAGQAVGLDHPGNTIDVTMAGAKHPLKATLVGTSVTPNQTQATACTFTVLPNNNSTSGNGRGPITNFTNIRSVYLITAAELAANGLVAGAVPTGIGWNYQTAPVAGSAPLIVYLQNTSDATNTKSTTWATAITGMTIVHNATTSLPGTATPFDITFSGGSPFTYTGGGLYVAFDWGTYAGTLGAGALWCTTTLTNGCLTGQSATGVPPTTLAASSFRAETRITAPVPNNDASVDLIASLGTVPLGLSGPLTFTAVVTDKGLNNLTNLPVTLNITGAENFTNTQTIGSLSSCGGQTTVTFAPFTPSVIGSYTATVSVPNDDSNGNNSRSKNFNTNIPLYTYKYPGSTLSGGFGLGAAGAIVAKFTTVAATNITNVNLEFASAGGSYRVAIFKDSGVGTPGNLVYQDAANRTATAGAVNLALSPAVAVGPGNFFVGIYQMNATNVALSFDTEAPVRSGQFFLGGGTPPATWTDFAPGNNFKPNIGITVDRCNITPTASNNGPINSGATLQLNGSAAGAGTYSWTGPSGFTSTQQNPSIPNATSANSGTYTLTVNGCVQQATTVAQVNGPFTILATASAGGAISPNGAVSVNGGATQTFNTMPNPCFSLSDVQVDGNSVGAVASYTFSNVQANHTIHATFTQNAYTIAASAGTGGSISPTGNVSVLCGNNQSFTITPNGGYAISDVVVDGSSVGAVASYTFNNVQAGHSIAASFAQGAGTIGGPGSTAYLCPGTSCVTVPVSLTRSYSNAVRAYHVSIQLSPELALCSGTSSITEGSFLSASGGTLFHVVDDGGGRYTIDDALTSNCGPTGNGTLFTIGVSNTVPGGTGTITITNTTLRDCSNGALAVVPGGPTSVPIDAQNPAITVTAPNGGELWFAGSTQNITWTASDNVGVTAVDLSYSTDGGATYPNVIATGLPNSGSYAWTVPNVSTTTARVKATAHDAGCGSASDASDADFTIRGPQIVASAGPNGSITPSGVQNETYGGSQSFAIAADPGYCIQDVKVDGGSVGPVPSYSFTNIVADHTIAASFALDVSTIGAQSTATYICPSNTCVTLPVTLARDCQDPVLGFSVTIHLSANLSLCSGTGSIQEGTFLSSVGSTTFQVLDNGGGSYTVDGAILNNCGPTATNGTLFTVGVTSSAATGPGSITVSDLKLRDCSNNALATAAGPAGTVPIDNQAPSVTVIAPNGGEVWPIGSSQTITWTATDNTGVANVDLAYSTDGGATFPNVIATGVANSGSYLWTVANTPTTQARVRVTAHDVVCSTGFDASDANFTIRDPQIVASAGAGGSISPNGVVSVPYGTNQSFTITPDGCHSIADVVVDGGSVGAVASYTFGNVTTDHTIAASFSLNAYTIVASAGPGGSITPSGNVSVNCGGSQSFAIAADGCHTIGDVVVDGSSVGAVSSYTFSNVTANHTIAASFNLIPPTITAVTNLHAAQVKTGNDADGTTKITLTFVPPGGAASVEVWRKGFGSYPTYDDGGGSTPPAPGAYPPAGWTLTGVTASGQTDEPATRDFWYYVAYAKDACGNASPVSNETGGTLNYHLGDVTNGITNGQGDNTVTTADLSLLGAHYGLSGPALAGYEYLDVGPTTDFTTDARPTTDGRTDFEDLVMFAINYTPRVSIVKNAPPSATVADAHSTVNVARPGSVESGVDFDVPVRIQGGGDLQAVSVQLHWDAAIATPTGVTAGDYVAAHGGVMLSPGAGGADVALLGVGPGMAGEGELAMVHFHATASGDPAITVKTAIGRSAANQPVAVTIGAPVATVSLVRTTDLQPVIPNPAIGHAVVAYSLAKAGSVDLAIYSVDGRRVATLAHGVQDAGAYRVTWNGGDEHGAGIPAGVYYVRLNAPGYQKTRIVTLVR